MFPDEMPIICCWGSFGTCRGHQSGRWQGERKTGTHDTAVPESPLMLNFIWVCFRSGKTFGEQVGGDQCLQNGWQLKCQFEDQQFRRQWWFLHRGFIWIAWKLIIMELYGKGNSDLGSHQFEVRLFPPKNNWGVWDMLPKLLVGSVVCLVDWLVSWEVWLSTPKQTACNWSHLRAVVHWPSLQFYPQVSYEKSSKRLNELISVALSNPVVISHPNYWFSWQSIVNFYRISNTSKMDKRYPGNHYLIHTKQTTSGTEKE